MRLPALSSFLSSKRSWPSLILVNEFGPANTRAKKKQKRKTLSRKVARPKETWGPDEPAAAGFGQAESDYLPELPESLSARA